VIHRAARELLGRGIYGIYREIYAGSCYDALTDGLGGAELTAPSAGGR
jgi:hypothetical protein